MQRKSTKQQFSIHEMFQIKTGQNQLGIDGYKVVKKNVDLAKIIEERQYSSLKKIQNPKKYETKRGSYLDPILQVNREKIPYPVQYDLIVKWPEANPKNPKKLHVIQKNTIFDVYTNPKKVNEIPGVGRYNLQLTDQQIREQQQKLKEKKIKMSERISVFSNDEFKGNEVPATGKYHPHDIIIKFRDPPVWDNPKNFKSIHLESKKKEKKSSFPDAATYDPIPVNFPTFQKIFKEQENVKHTGNEPKSKLLGTEVRFPDVSKLKSKSTHVPGPGSYNLVQKWPGKLDDETQSQSVWNNRVSRGISRSIYY